MGLSFIAQYQTPLPISKEHIKIESEFLKEENKVIWEKRNIKNIYKKYIKWYNFIKYKKRRYIEID